MTVFILSAACCYPGLAAFDEKTKQVIEQAIKESGVPAEVKLLSGAAAVYSTVLSRPVMKNLLSRFYRTRTGPAVVINGEVLFLGVPQLEDMKDSLKKFIKYDNKKEFQNG